MKNLVINGKYNLSAIMKMAHAFIGAGCRNLASGLRKAWDWAQDAMMAHKVSLWQESRMTMTGQQLREMGFKLD